MYKFPSNFYVPNVFATLTLGAAWMAFIAVALATSVSAAPSPVDVVIRVLLTLGAAAAAVGFLLAGLRLRDSEEDGDRMLRQNLRSVSLPSPVMARVRDRVA
ncbi:MAG: hypothetical protein ACM3US_03520 [Sphingomonadaceae bacterium]